jgi:FG-GAP repeat
MLRFLNWKMALLIACLLTISTMGLFRILAPGKVVVWRGETKIMPKDRESRSGFGSDIAIDGNIAVIGAPSDSSLGMAYIYERSGNDWIEKAKLQPGDQDFYRPGGFGRTVVISGNTIVIGTPGNAIYVFVRQGDRWIQQAKLTADINSLDTLAASLAFSQNTIVVAADVLASSRSRRFYVFERDPETSTWSQANQVVPPPGTISSGNAVATDGNTIVLSGLNNAVVYNRHLTSRQWAYQTILNSDYPDRDTIFGYSVAVENDTIVIGVPSEQDKPMIAIGAVYVFERQPETSQWKRKTKLLPHGANIGNFVEQFVNPYKFGARVAIHGDKILVGACTVLYQRATVFLISPLQKQQLTFTSKIQSLANGCNNRKY